VLYDRLADLATAGLIEKGEDGAYQLTELGVGLGAALAPLDSWAKRWAEDHPV
jgi:DNA-binding HxlR family transcriptional regulator